MTLIGAACMGDRAIIITDAMTYSPNLGRIGTTTKATLIPHLDAAILTQGDGTFGGYAMTLGNVNIGFAGDESFDRFVEGIRSDLRQLWSDVGGWSEPTPVIPSVVLVVGWSAAAGVFTAHRFLSERDFEPERVDFHLMPMPLHYALPAYEAARLREWITDSEVDPADIDHVLTRWESFPECPIPTTAEEWVDLALEARASRALTEHSPIRVLVGGSLVMTEIVRGGSTTRRVVTFDDTGDNLLTMVGYSQHPAAQQRPCHCGSGRTFLECHLADQLDQPCGCESGGLFRDCCMVGANHHLEEITHV